MAPAFGGPPPSGDCPFGGCDVCDEWWTDILPEGWTWGEIAEGFLIGAGTAGTSLGKAITLSTVGEWLKGLDDDCPDDFLGEPLMPTGKRRKSTYGNSHPEGKFGGPIN